MPKSVNEIRSRLTDASLMENKGPTPAQRARQYNTSAQYEGLQQIRRNAYELYQRLDSGMYRQVMEGVIKQDPAAIKKADELIRKFRALTRNL